MKKKRKGERVRPCTRCEQPVKFIKGAWAAYGTRRCGWHWVNEDGAHHRCGDFRQLGQDTLAIQWREAVERDERIVNRNPGCDLPQSWRTEPEKPKRKTKPPPLFSAPGPDDDISDLWAT